MKSLFIFFNAIVFLFALHYLVWAFVFDNVNSSTWGHDARSSMCWIWLCFVIVAGVITAVVEIEKNIK